LTAALAAAPVVAQAQSEAPAVQKGDKPTAKKSAPKTPATKQAPLSTPAPVKAAAAPLQSTSASKVTGKVEFTKLAKGIQIRASVTGLEPGSKHGFHIHEFGDCSAPDATSAGSHFSSPGAMHSGPGAKRGKRHEGDLGNLTADADGNASYERVDLMIAFEGKRSILGRSVIVHADVDDLKTQPTGNAGARVACGVIGVAK